MNEDRPDPADGRSTPASSVPPSAGLPDGVSALDPAPETPGERSLSPPGPQSDRYLGCTIDNRYKVEGIIGEGGMGVVYRCRHKIIDKRVAIKILRADLAKDPEVTQRFLMEAKAASAIQDEHIISISDFGQLPDGAAYFVMEFLEGTPLATLAGAGPMPIERLKGIASQLAEGLSSAHHMGIVHRDLKPDNVFLISRGKEADFVKILDFGIAKVSTMREGRLTQVGSVFGTPHYMSPEQASGAPLDHRGDIYSFGIILYELSTGQVPFDAENFVGILSQQLYQEPIPPSAANPGANVPPELEAIILKCLAKRPEDRYQSMIDLRDDLHDLGAEAARISTPIGTGVSSELAPSVEGAALSTEELVAFRSRRWVTYLAFAAPLAVVGLIFAAQLSQAGGAGQGAPAAPLSPPEPLPSEPAEAPKERGTTDDVPLPTQVLLGASPADAHVFKDGLNLGQSPVAIDIPRGEVVVVEVRHPDFETERLELDGSRGRMTVELSSKTSTHESAALRKKKTAARRARARRRRAAKRRTKTRGKSESKPLGGQLFVEPWQKP